MQAAVGWAAVVLTLTLSGCGTYTPLKDPLHPNDLNPEGLSREGRAEANIVSNIRCEIQRGLYNASRFREVGYLGTTWGTQVTLKLTWDEMSSLAPNFAYIDPIAAMQTFTIGAGVGASAHATRLETITFLFENHALLDDARTNVAKHLPLDCSKQASGISVESDLRIDEFIYDKATIAKANVATTEDPSQPQFSTFQEDLTFVGTLGGNVTPTWKLTRVNADSTGTLAGATRSTTGDVLVTLGPLATDSRGNLLHRLGDPAASQHTAGIIGGSVASQNKSQSP